MHTLQLTAAAACAALICGAAPALAGDIVAAADTDAPSVGIGMICNTPEQARQYLDFRASGAPSQDAMQRVNEAAQNPHACGVAAIAFVPDKMLHAHFVENKLLEIVRVSVLAGFDGTNWQDMPSVVQYAVMEGKGDAI